MGVGSETARGKVVPCCADKKSELHLTNGVDLFVRGTKQTHSSQETVRCYQDGRPAQWWHLQRAAGRPRPRLLLRPGQLGGGLAADMLRDGAVPEGAQREGGEGDGGAGRPRPPSRLRRVLDQARVARGGLRAGQL